MHGHTTTATASFNPALKPETELTRPLENMITAVVSKRHKVVETENGNLKKKKKGKKKKKAGRFAVSR